MEDGRLDMNWTLLTDVLNRELHDDAPLAESTYRKAYQAARSYYDEVFLPMMVEKDGGDIVDDVRLQRLELEKERVRMRDERNETARLIREQARKGSAIELLHEVIRSEVAPMDGYVDLPCPTSDNDLIVHLTDLHAGLSTDNFVNKFNEHVLEGRLWQYLSQIKSIAARHGSENCYILLGGDLLSGLIHSDLRLENNLNIVQQVKTVSLIICQFIKELSKTFGFVNVYSVPGNHSRCLPKKEDNLKGENLDILVFFYAQAALQNYENVNFGGNDVEESVAIFRVRQQLVYGVHGDKDTMSSVVQHLTMFFGEKPDIVLAGHRHTNGLTTVYDSKIIESGCVSGPDNYCMDRRLRNKPEQMVAVVSENGLECLYDVKLD